MKPIDRRVPTPSSGKIGAGKEGPSKALKSQAEKIKTTLKAHQWGKMPAEAPKKHHIQVIPPNRNITSKIETASQRAL